MVERLAVGQTHSIFVILSQEDCQVGRYHVIPISLTLLL